MTASPEHEDFRGKYESGRVGQALLDRYFSAVEELVSQLSSSERGTAIEIGCGEGLSTARLRRILTTDWAFEASEFLDRQVEIARLNNPGLEVRQEDIYELTHSDEAFDLVFLLEVLEHLDSPRAGLAEVLRVLRPGGYLIAGVPREPLWRILNMVRGKYLRSLGNTPGHLNHWSARAFRTYLTRSFGTVVASRLPIPWTIVLAQKRE